MKTGNLYCEISVPAGAEHRRGEVMQAALNAIAIVEAFARANAWTHLTKERFFSRIEILSSKEALWKRLLEMSQLPPDMPTPTDAVTAVIEKIHLWRPSLKRRSVPARNISKHISIGCKPLHMKWCISCIYAYSMVMKKQWDRNGFTRGLQLSAPASLWAKISVFRM